jgi:hypothetical protein
VVAAVAAALGAASYGWARRLQSAVPALALGFIALLVVPIVVPVLVTRRGTQWSPRAMYAPTVAALVSYAAALLLSYLASVEGFAI